MDALDLGEGNGLVRAVDGEEFDSLGAAELGRVKIARLRFSVEVNDDDLLESRSGLMSAQWQRDGCPRGVSMLC